MMLEWMPDMIRFMKDASEYGSFTEELGVVVREELGTGLHLCDAGCGLGYLSLEMAGFSARVTAADTNPDALAVLREKAAERQLRNLRITEQDVFRPEWKEQFDGMVFCLMGDVKDVAEAGRRLCTGRMMMISKNYSRHRFSAGKYENAQPEAPERYLRARGISCRHRELEIEYGQPFRCLSDAVLFYRTYSVDPDKARITEKFVREKLTETGDPVFPWYLPHRRRLTVTVWEAGDLR